MQVRLKIKPKTILFHAVFWVAVWFFFFYFFSYNSENQAYSIWFSSGLLPLTMALTYVVNYKLIPKYLLTKKYLKFALYSFYTLIFASYIIVFVIYACYIFIQNFNIAIMPPMSKNFFFILILVLVVVGVISSISLLNYSFKTNTRNKELQNKILNTQLQLKEQELHYLKKQIHPHFLFNTLNTIYGFALKQSKQTPEIILKLSNLLDYILYQVNKPKVSLKEEVLHINEYIELERIRFQDSLKVNLIWDEIDEKIEIAPMLMIPFVENAFKHGSIVNGFLQIEIKVLMQDKKLVFEIENSFKPDEDEKTGGLGLANIQKRLDLNYKDNYLLTHNVKNEKYLAKLEIFNVNQFRDE